MNLVEEQSYLATRADAAASELAIEVDIKGDHFGTWNIATYRRAACFEALRNDMTHHPILHFISFDDVPFFAADDE